MERHLPTSGLRSLIASTKRQMSVFAVNMDLFAISAVTTTYVALVRFNGVQSPESKQVSIMCGKVV